MNNNFKSIILTDSELAILDDGQGWWKDGDTVYLGGYLPDDYNNNPAFVLQVNNSTNENWTYWNDLPQTIKNHLMTEK
jgi:hypothetical protein